MSTEFPPGSVGKSVTILLRSTNDGQPKLGLTANSAGADASYYRVGGTSTPIALSNLGIVTDPWIAGGFIAVNAKGEYRLCVPDASLAVGADEVTVNLAFDGTFTEAIKILLRNPVNNVGAGAISWPVTITNSATSLPLSGAEVWVTTDEAGTNTVAGTLTTNSAGTVTFLLDAGDYFVWAKHDNFDGTNPTPITVA